MPDMPMWIAKGNILMALDAADKETLIAIRQGLNDGVAVDEVARINLGLSADAATHLREDWFRPTGWFGYDASQVIREAFVHAINVVNPGQKGDVRHLDCYWICVRGDADLAVQVVVSGRPGSVVVIIKTPVPNRPPARAGTTPHEEVFRLVFEGQVPFSPQYREI
jgi:hypothetical protein